MRKDRPRDCNDWWYHHEAAGELVKCLEPVHRREGLWFMDLFRDFLEIVEICLDRAPTALRSPLETGNAGDDPPEIAARWAAVKERYRYPRESFQDFVHAFGLLLEASAYPDGQPSYADVLGLAYMQFVPSGKGQNYRGQYFTPWNVARMMALMLYDESIEREAQTRLKAAIEKNPMAEATMLATAAFADSEDAEAQRAAQEAVYTRLLPLVRQHLRPITMIDPSCGSGIMLLAWASAMPRYLIDWGLVEFYGVDIDPTCVAMARLNCRLYGLNPWAGSIIAADSLTGDALTRLPPPYDELYTAAATTESEAERAAAVERIDAIRQMPLFTAEADAVPAGARDRKATNAPRRRRESIEALPLPFDP